MLDEDHLNMLHHAMRLATDNQTIYDFDDFLVKTEVEAYKIIYDKEFAKAIWGETDYSDDFPDGVPVYEPWQWHLMQMVISDDPIQYLSDHS